MAVGKLDSKAAAPACAVVSAVRHEIFIAPRFSFQFSELSKMQRVLLNSESIKDTPMSYKHFRRWRGCFSLCYIPLHLIAKQLDRENENP
jgi:hypothetical protein